MIALSTALACLVPQAGGQHLLVVGEDGSSLANDLIAHGYNVTVTGDDLLMLAVGQQGYDVVITTASHGNPPAPRRLLVQVRRLLSANGVIIVGIDPLGESQSTWSRRAQLIEDLCGAGFRCEGISAALRERCDPADWLLVARPIIAPPRSLAVQAWGMTTDAQLDLRYCTDETELLTVSPETIWRETLATYPSEGAELIAGYPVEDPFGSQRGAEVVAGHFGCDLSSEQVIFAAGVTSLLHDLHRLADCGPILAPSLIHPDLGAWAVASGARVALLNEQLDDDMLVSRVAATRPGLVQLDRPGFTGETVSLDALRAVNTAATAANAVVIVDESAAAYLGPSQSAVTLVPDVRNLVVLRGFTKVYSWGGLRCGYAVSSANIADRIREVVAPMQVGELAFVAALRMLGAGDVASALRARIRAVKPGFCAKVASLGLNITHRGHSDVPWLVVDDTRGNASRFLASRQIRGLAPAPAVTGVTRQLLHLSVPLSDERMRLFQQLAVGPEQQCDAVDEDQVLTVRQRS